MRFDEAVHLAHGDAAAEALRRQGARSVLVRRDLLTVGPCDADAGRHRALRIAQWRLPENTEGLLGAGDLRAAVTALHPSAALVLWATTAWSDQLSLWWALDGLSDFPVERLWLAEPRADHPLASVGGVGDDAIAAAWTEARPASPASVRQGGELWRKYADASPLSFDEARRSGVAQFPALARTATVHGGWFPRRDDGTLRLAELDQLLLSRLDDDWRRPHQLTGLEPILYPFGDLFLGARLDAWAERGVIERRVDGDRPSYRQSEPARRLLAEGAGSVAHLPPLFVGGCRVNDPAAPWERVPLDDNWRIAPPMH